MWRCQIADSGAAIARMQSSLNFTLNVIVTRPEARRIPSKCKICLLPCILWVGKGPGDERKEVKQDLLPLFLLLSLRSEKRTAKRQFDMVDWNCDRLCGLAVSSWLQIQRSGFDFWRYQIFWEVVGLERGPFNLVSTTEELLERKSSGSGWESREYCRRDPSRWPCGTLCPQKMALISSTSGGQSIGIVRSRTQTTEFVCWFIVWDFNNGNYSREEISYAVMCKSMTRHTLVLCWKRTEMRLQHILPRLTAEFHLLLFPVE
jgi:hypothetical protein